MLLAHTAGSSQAHSPSFQVKHSVILQLPKISFLASQTPDKLKVSSKVRCILDSPFLQPSPQSPLCSPVPAHPATRSLSQCKLHFAQALPLVWCICCLNRQMQSVLTAEWSELSLCTRGEIVYYPDPAPASGIFYCGGGVKAFTSWNENNCLE